MSMDLDSVSSSLDTGANGSTKIKKRKLLEADGQTPKKRKKQSQSAAETLSASPEAPVSVTNKKSKVKRVRQEVPATDTSASVHSVEPQQLDVTSTAIPDSSLPNGTLESNTLNANTEDHKNHFTPSNDLSPFHSKRISLYLPVYAVSLSSATASLLSTHLAPLLLTYYPPVKGVVLAFSDPVLSAKPAQSPSLPLKPPAKPPSSNSEILALSADEYGVSWVWLTVTLLVFQPEKYMDMEGYLNTCSEGFIGLVSYNYFQTAIPKNRVPESWTWTGPGANPTTRRRRKGKVSKLRDSDSQDDRSTPMPVDSSDPMSTAPEPPDDGLGFFSDPNGVPITSSKALPFQVVDSEVVPLHGRDRLALQIEGTLLTTAEEALVLAEEAVRFDQIQKRGRSGTPGRALGRIGSEALMSGGIGMVIRESSNPETPVRRHRLAY